MSISSISTIVLVSTTVFSLIKTFSVIRSELVLLITTCLNLQWAWWMFNPLRDSKSWSHKVHVWTMLGTWQTVRYKLSHEKCLSQNGCKIHFYSWIQVPCYPCQYNCIVLSKIFTNLCIQIVYFKRFFIISSKNTKY